MKQKHLLLALPLLILMACTQEEPIPGYEYNAVNPKSVAEALVHLHPDKDICKEIHAAVRKAVSLGLDESYYFAEAIGNGEKITNSSKVNRNIQKKLKSLSTGNSIKEVFTKVVEEDEYMNHYQIYWPYSEYWDGNTMPTITFQTEAAEPQEENVGYRIVNDCIEEVNVNEEYAKKNPVWIINYNPIPYEAYPDFAIQNWTRTEKDYKNKCSEHIVSYAQAYIQGSKKNPKLPDYVYNLQEINLKQDTLSLYLKNIKLNLEYEVKPFFSGGLHYMFTICVDDEDENDSEKLRELAKHMSNIEIRQSLEPETRTIRFVLLRQNIDPKGVVVSLHSLLSWQWLYFEDASQYSLKQEISHYNKDYNIEYACYNLYDNEHSWYYCCVYRNYCSNYETIAHTGFSRRTFEECDVYLIDAENGWRNSRPICSFGVTKGRTTPEWHSQVK